MNTDITIASPATPPMRPQATSEPAVVTPALKAAQVSENAPALQKTNAVADPAKQHQRLEEALNRLNEMMKNSGRNLSFSRDAAINATVITVKDTNSGEVVRQIPNEAVLRVAHNIEKLKGMLHNEKI